MKLTIWHKATCSTSRNVLQLLEEKGYEISIRLYLEDIPSENELIDVLSKMGEKPEYIVRKKESLYQEKYKNKKISPKKWLSILSKQPILIERPIVISQDKAWLARPFDEWVKLFNAQ